MIAHVLYNKNNFNKKKKNWKKNLKKNLHARNVAISIKSGEKHFFCFGYATHNKALDMMKLVSNFLIPSENLWCKFRKNRQLPSFHDDFDHCCQSF